MENREPRFFIASITASLVVLLIPLALGLHTVAGPPLLNADGTPDNAPMRAAGLFVFVSPFLWIAGTICVYVLTRVLGLFGWLSKRSLALVIGAASVALAFRAANLDPSDEDTITWLVFFALALVFGSLGAATWWFVALFCQYPSDSAPRGPNKAASGDGHYGAVR